MAYNIPGVTNLVLTREEIVGIYNGSIDNWSDPIFVRHNPGVDLPNATIVPIARGDSSGATDIFTRSLSSFSDAWAARYGIFCSRAGWNGSVVKMFAARTSEMADIIRREPYHVGYMITASAVEVDLPFASIINKRGRVTVGNKRSLQAAMDERLNNMTSRLTTNLIDCETEETYPIAAYSYFVVHMSQSGNCSTAVELARYVEWFLASTQAETDAQQHLMVPVSAVVADKIRSAVLERMTCDGRRLMDLVRRQKYEEEESLKTWKLPIAIVTPFVAAIILVLVAYAIRHRIQHLRMLDRDDWKINFFDIEFVVRKKRCRTASQAGDGDDSSLTSSTENCSGRWNIHDIVTRPLSIAQVFDVNRRVKQTLMHMREEVGHENIAKFFGISTCNESIYLVEQYCANGTLVDFLKNSKYSVNQSFRYIVSADIANGMAYLHRQNVIHGNLSIGKVHVDSRWTIKIVDWEYPTLYDVVRRTDRKHEQTISQKSILHFLCEDNGSRSTSWSFRHLAPEIQKDGRLAEPTRAGDVYSFGIIVRDLFLNWSQPEHPEIDMIPDKARQIIGLACHENSVKRPTFLQLEKSMRSSITHRQTNLLDRYV